MDNTFIPFVLINDRKMIDAKYVHKLLECKYDFKHWIKDVISSFSFNRVLVENLIETFETMQNIYSDNYGIKVYTGNCIIQLNVNPKDPSESFFDVYDRDEMKLIYGIKISILKEMFII